MFLLPLCCTDAQPPTLTSSTVTSGGAASGRFGVGDVITFVFVLSESGPDAPLQLFRAPNTVQVGLVRADACFPMNVGRGGGAARVSQYD